MQWVPGHEGLQGNEAVDGEAKAAAEGDSSWKARLPVLLRGSRLPTSASAAKQFFFEDTKERWAREWKRSPRYQRILRVDESTPSNKFLTLAGELKRNEASLLFQLRTGHIPLRAHLYKIKKATSPSCPHCGNDDQHETVFHYLIQCEHYRHERHILFLKLKRMASSLSYLLTSDDAVAPLLSFVHATSRLRSTFGDVVT